MVHKYEIRVRYSDTDQMQRLHHAAYVEYLEVVRIEFASDLWDFHTVTRWRNQVTCCL